MDLSDAYRILHPTTTQYTLFSAAHGTLHKIDLFFYGSKKPQQIKENRNNPYILCDHNAIKLNSTTKTIAENMQITGG
jgi:hypothetical protein